MYFIKEGEFEVTKEINIKKHTEDFISSRRQTDLTMGQRLILVKKQQQKQDPTVNQIRLALLGTGECFGLEECNSSAPMRRQTKVVCTKNGSVCYFISIQDFKERIIGDKVQLDIDTENQFKQIFYQTRESNAKVFGSIEQDVHLQNHQFRHHSLNPFSETRAEFQLNEYLNDVQQKEYI